MKLIFKSHNLLLLSFFIVFFFNYSYSQKGKTTIVEDDKIPQMLSLKKSLEEENKLTVGYTIQLFYGEKNMANDIIKQYRNSFTSWPASIKYETPNYKVWAGNFSSRLEADRAIMEIKKKFPTAFILKPERK
jgi:hypothetical protein